MNNKPLISKPLFILLLLSVIFSILAMLKPSNQTQNEADDLLADSSIKPRKDSNGTDVELAKSISWHRHLSEFKKIKPHDTVTVPITMPTLSQPLSSVISAPMIESSVLVETKPRVVTPNLPFTYLGRLIDAKKTNIFLALNGDNMTVALGEVIEKNWKVESISDTVINFRYLPSNTLQQLVIEP